VIRGDPDRSAQGRLDDIAKPKAATVAKSLTVNELIVQFVTRETPRFSNGEAYAFRAAIKVLRPLFGETPVSDFGPLRYRLVRDAMVSGDPETGRKPWARPTVNRQIKRIRQIFR